MFHCIEMFMKKKSYFTTEFDNHSSRSVIKQTFHTTRHELIEIKHVLLFTQTSAIH